MKNGFLSLVFLLLATPAVQAQLAAGQSKFLGNILSTSRSDEEFATYWNKVTPEDNGKLGYVEPTRGPMNWSVLDAMYEYAQEHGFPFKEHTFVWGRQQPQRINTLSAGDQRMEVRSWIREFGFRYPRTAKRNKWAARSERQRVIAPSQKTSRKTDLAPRGSVGAGNPRL